MSFRMPAVVIAALLSVAAALVIAAAPADAGAFTDAAGRRVVLPDRVTRILPADRNAEVLVFVLAPDQLAGLERTPEGRPAATGRYIPVLQWGPRSSPAAMAATARQMGADLIIDGGTVTPDRVAFADAVQQLTHIPYILVDDGFSRMPDMLRSLGAILGAADRADDLAIFADHAISGLRGRLLITPADDRPHIYYALGADGLTTALPGSPAGAALDEAGAINVAAPLGRGTEVAVSPAQLAMWDPPIIIAEHRGFFDAVRRNPAWHRLSAVRNKKVYLEPTDPFGWIEDPSGVNRLIGLNWLSTLFYPTATQEDLRTTVCDFYNKFYRIKLTNARIEALVRPAGALPPEAGRYAPEPLIGLGAAPPSSLAGPGGPSERAPAPSEPPGGPSAITGVPGLPNTAPTATCAIPTGPTPQPLPGIIPDEAGPPPGAALGLPPGRRGRPSPGTGAPRGNNP
jgi:iron complex transport system substrate-binding protein